MMHHFAPLTPTVFLERSGKVFPNATAVRDELGVLSYGELLRRARKLAAGLRGLGVSSGDRVALLADNCRPIIEANFGVPGAGAVIVSLNPWLETEQLVEQLKWVDGRVLLVSHACLRRHGAERLSDSGKRRLVVFGRERPAEADDYEALIEAGRDSAALDRAVTDEADPIVINFTSGTTGTPKGVVMSHRAAYLHAIGQVLMLGLSRPSRYLWTLPMFHVNGWGHLWANAVVGAEQIISALPSSGAANDAHFCERVRDWGVTHLAGAPRLLRRILELDGAALALRGCTVVTGGAAPARALLEQLEAAGVKLIHQYGLNETFGPFVVCEEQPGWQGAEPDHRSALRSRQGVAGVHVGTGLRIVTASGEDVPADGKTCGEVVMSGNTVALGYFGAPEATAHAFKDGWFHSGDLAVVHPDGYLEIKDRIKDLIYVETDYGWENISSTEVENVLLQCPGVGDTALLGVQNAGAGSSAQLVAVIEPSSPFPPSFEDLHGFCARHLPAHMRPSRFLLSSIPKTATGKTRKDLLVARALNELASPTSSLSPSLV